MPYMSTHISVGIDYLNRENIEGEDKILFLIGTLLPDIKGKGLVRQKTHYYKNKEEFLSGKFIDNFIKSEKIIENGKINYLLYGYLLHLYTDKGFIEKDYFYKHGTQEHKLWNVGRELNAKNDFYYTLGIEEEFDKIKKYLIKNKKIKGLTQTYKNIENISELIIDDIDNVILMTSGKSNFLYDMLSGYEGLRKQDKNLDENIKEFKKHFTSSYNHRQLKIKLVDEFSKKVKKLKKVA